MYDQSALRGSELVIGHWTSPHPDEHCRLEQCGRQYVLLGTSSCRRAHSSAAWRACGRSTMQDHSRGPGIKGSNE
jgi:hypothetical protein